jgi:hypothetical protein
MVHADLGDYGDFAIKVATEDLHGRAFEVGWDGAQSSRNFGWMITACSAANVRKLPQNG